MSELVRTPSGASEQVEVSNLLTSSEQIAHSSEQLAHREQFAHFSEQKSEQLAHLSKIAHF